MKWAVLLFTDPCVMFLGWVPGLNALGPVPTSGASSYGFAAARKLAREYGGRLTTPPRWCEDSGRYEWTERDEVSP